MGKYVEIVGSERIIVNEHSTVSLFGEIGKKKDQQPNLADGLFKKDDFT